MFQVLTLSSFLDYTETHYSHTDTYSHPSFTPPLKPVVRLSTNRLYHVLIPILIHPLAENPPFPHHHHATAKRSCQCHLKYIIFSVPFLHTKSRHVDSADSGPKGTPQDELSANHMMAERRRREKLNERFVLLRSLVPFVTKMDKASILSDTIKYVKQLCEKVEDLEGRTPQMVEVDQRTPQMTVVEESGGVRPKAVAAEAAQVEVSIIESDVLVELECLYREGILLDVMRKLRELRLEITTVDSSLNNGVFDAEMRAKVMQNVNGKKVTIMGVKREIKEIIASIKYTD